MIHYYLLKSEKKYLLFWAKIKKKCKNLHIQRLLWYFDQYFCYQLNTTNVSMYFQMSRSFINCWSWLRPRGSSRRRRRVHAHTATEGNNLRRPNAKATTEWDLNSPALRVYLDSRQFESFIRQRRTIGYCRESKVVFLLFFWAGCEKPTDLVDWCVKRPSTYWFLDCNSNVLPPIDLKLDRVVEHHLC